MATIPEVRNKLSEIATTLEFGASEKDVAEAAKAIRWAIEQLHRRPYARKAREKSRPMTEGLARLIKAHAEKHPGASYMEIAQVFRVSIGRVSEVINGRRT